MGVLPFFITNGIKEKKRMNETNTMDLAVSSNQPFGLADIKSAINTYHQKQDRKMNQLWSAVNRGLGSSVPNGTKSHHHHLLQSKGYKTMDLQGLKEFVTSGIQHKSLSSTDESGGYMVPHPVQEYITTISPVSGSIRSLARVSMISTDSLEVMTDAETSEVGWVAEKGDRDETKAPLMHRRKIGVHEVYSKPMISQKLLDDAAIQVEEWLVDHIANAMMKIENHGFVNGDGQGKPKGFLSYPRVAVGSGAPGSIETVSTGIKGGLKNIDVFFDALEAMKPMYLDGAVWYMSRSAITKIRRLKTSDGLPIWQPSVIQDQPDMLLGYPVVLSDDMPAIRDNEACVPIVLANFKRGYHVVDRHDMRLLRDPYSSKPFVEFYVTKRVGGDVVDFDAFKAITFGG